MKVFIITQNEPFYLPIFLEKVISTKKKDIVGVCVLSEMKQNGSIKKTIMNYLDVFGIKEFFIRSFLYIWFKFLDFLPGGKKFGRFYSTKKIAHCYGIKLYNTDNINSSKFLSVLRNIQPDLIVSVAAPQVFKQEILNLPKMGCINVHGAPLPKYRGMLPSFWMLANDERDGAVTVHFMDEKLDSGDIILQKKYPVESEDTLHSLLLKSKKIGAELLLEVFEQFENGGVSRRPNDSQQATYYSFPTRQDIQRFHLMGRRFR